VPNAAILGAGVTVLQLIINKKSLATDFLGSLTWQAVPDLYQLSTISILLCDYWSLVLSLL